MDFILFDGLVDLTCWMTWSLEKPGGWLYLMWIILCGLLCVDFILIDGLVDLTFWSLEKPGG